MGAFCCAKSRQVFAGRKPHAGRDEDRYFGTFTLRPRKHTVVRVYYEDATLDMTTPRNVRFGDQVTPWLKAGRPAFDNGLTNPTLITAANSGIFARNTSTRTLLSTGAAAPGTPYTSWGAGANANIALPATRYAAITLGPGSQPNQTGVDAYVCRLPYDESISPFGVGQLEIVREQVCLA